MKIIELEEELDQALREIYCMSDEDKVRFLVAMYDNVDNLVAAIFTHAFNTEKGMPEEHEFTLKMIEYGRAKMLDNVVDLEILRK